MVARKAGNALTVLSAIGTAAKALEAAGFPVAEKLESLGGTTTQMTREQAVNEIQMGFNQGTVQDGPLW